MRIFGNSSDTERTHSAWRELLEYIPENLFLKDSDSVYIAVTPSMAQRMGIGADEMIGKTDGEILSDPVRSKLYIDTDRELLSSGKSRLDVMDSWTASDGERHFFKTTKYAVRPKHGRAAILGLMRDVTREVESRESYNGKFQRLTTLTDDAYGCMVVDVTEWRIASVTKGSLAYPFEGKRCASPDDFIELEAKSSRSDETRRFLRGLGGSAIFETHRLGERTITREYQRVMPDMSLRFVRLSINLLTEPDSMHLLAICVLRDIDEEKRVELELKRAAERDSMTGLLNHEVTVSRIENALSRDSGGTHALFMIDIDNFKSINDTFGHSTGDDVIKRAASELQRVFRSTDIIGRIGGDEFLVLMCDVGRFWNIRQKAHELVRSLQYSCRKGGNVIHATCSVGVSVCRETDRSFKSLYDDANDAMYRAKSLGKNRCVFSSGDESGQIGDDADDPAEVIHLNTLLENMAGGVSVIELGDTPNDIEIIYTSPSFFKLSRGNEALYGQRGERMFDAVHPDDREALFDALFNTREGGLCEFQYRVTTPDGKLEWRHIRSALMPGVTPGKKRLISVVTDITNIKLAEESSAFDELKYRTALEESGLLVFEINLSTRELSLSGSLADRLGLSACAIPDLPNVPGILGMTDEDSISEFSRMMTDVFQGSPNGEYAMLLNPKGKELFIRVSFRMLSDKGGKPFYAVGAAHSSFDTRELELYRTMEHGGVFSVLLDDGLTLLFANDRYYSIHGLTKKSFREKFGGKCLPLIHPDDVQMVTDEIKKVVARDLSHAVLKIRAVTGTGGILYVQISGRTSRLADGRYVIDGVIIDVTEQSQNELALEDRKQELTKLYRHAIETRNSADADSIGSFYLNLTQNIAGDGHVLQGAFDPLDGAKDLDGFFERLYSMLPTDEARQKYSEVFSRPAMLRAFGEGRNYISLEHRYRIRSERTEWVRTAAIIMRNPDTNDVESFIFTHSVDAEMIARRLTARAIKYDHEYMALIDSSTGIVTLYGESSPDVQYLPENGKPYNDQLIAFIKSALPDVGANVATSRMSLDAVKRGLESNPTYTVSFALRAGNRASYKKWSFFYLDEGRDVIAHTRSDVTDVYVMGTDSVTGIYNRDKFNAVCRERLDSDPDTRYAILLLDIDSFKAFNALYGVAEGDGLLSYIGSMLRSLDIPKYAFGRLQADNFACMLPADSLSRFPKSAELSERLHEKYPAFDFSPRIGVYFIDDSGIDIRLMCDRALLALRSVKQSASLHIGFYSEAMSTELLREQELSSDIRAAFDGDEFDAYLQPIFDMESGSVVAAEALVRWLHPVKGLLKPNSFIPMLEKNGYITRLDMLIFKRVCALLRSWLDSGIKVVPISVNLSRLDIYDNQLCDSMQRLLEKYDIPSSLVRLEITETAYTENAEQLIEAAEQLRKRGFIVEMDDFGSGYSSLNILKEVPVDLLKLDMRFLSNPDGDGKSGIILSSIIRMAHWLNMPVIAEGIETERQATYLRSIGCNLAQGYLFSRPLPASEFRELLTNVDTSVFDRNERLAGRIDFSDFWDPDSMTTLLFSEFVGAAILLEYNGKKGSLEPMRVNADFKEELSLDDAAIANIRNDLFSVICRDDADSLRRALNEAANGNGSKCPFRCRESFDSKKQWLSLRARIKFLAKVGDIETFFVSVTQG